VVDLIAKAERPLLIAGHGVFHRKAWAPLLTAVEKNDIAVVTSGPMRGHFPDDHRLSASLAPRSFMSADLIVFVGQYSMPSPNEYRVNPDVKAVRIHPEGGDLGRNWPLELGVVGDELAFLEALANALPRRTRAAWVSEVAAARKTYEDELARNYENGVKWSADTGALHPSVIGKELNDFLYKGKIDPKQTLSGWGGFSWQRTTVPFLRANRAGQEIVCPYQFGAIGPDMAMMIGAATAAKDGTGPQQPYKGAPSVCLTTDAGMGFTLMELDTAVKYKVPLITVVYNNNCWGTWTMTAGMPRSVHLHLFQENIRYDRIAENLGAFGAYVRKPEEMRAALQQAYDVASKQGLPALINVQAKKEFSSAREYPPGGGMGFEPGITGFQH
jgi:thiamine pyrophosphate-dependent acetolactate synthase large subunit-like protein